MHKFKKCLLFLFLCLGVSNVTFADPPDPVEGRLVFLGLTNDSSRSVWLSVTTSGSFRLEAQGQQIIDEWDRDNFGLHLSISPIVSQGNGGTHFLINAINNKKLDSQNQKGGIVFPPLPDIPIDGLRPEHPIVVPPGEQPGETPPSTPVQPPTGTINPITPPSTPGLNASNSNRSANTSRRNGDNVSGSRRSSQDDDNDQNAPLTDARQLKQESCWNIWSDNRYYNIKDQRKNLNAKGESVDFSMGADRLIAPHLVAGLMAHFIKYYTSSFNGGLTNSASGVSVGPYFGWRILPYWSVDGSFTYGQLQNHNTVVILDSNFRNQVYNGTLHTLVLIPLCYSFQLRPQALVSYSHFRNPNYQLNGLIRNYVIQIFRPSESFDFGYAEFKIEANKTIETKTRMVLQPYTEAGIDYQFARPNDGQIITGNLTLARVSPITEFMTLGCRSIFTKGLLLDASGKYLSFGQKDLHVWEAKLLVSYSFG
jgi:outer membrane autotransporter protein